MQRNQHPHHPPQRTHAAPAADSARKGFLFFDWWEWKGNRMGGIGWSITVITVAAIVGPTSSAILLPLDVALLVAVACHSAASSRPHSPPWSVLMLLPHIALLLKRNVIVLLGSLIVAFSLPFAIFFGSSLIVPQSLVSGGSLIVAVTRPIVSIVSLIFVILSIRPHVISLRRAALIFILRPISLLVPRFIPFSSSLILNIPILSSPISPILPLFFPFLLFRPSVLSRCSLPPFSIPSFLSVSIVSVSSLLRLVLSAPLPLLWIIPDESK